MSLDPKGMVIYPNSADMVAKAKALLDICKGFILIYDDGNGIGVINDRLTTEQARDMIECLDKHIKTNLLPRN